MIIFKFWSKSILMENRIKIVFSRNTITTDLREKLTKRVKNHFSKKFSNAIIVKNWSKSILFVVMVIWSKMLKSIKFLFWRTIRVILIYFDRKFIKTRFGQITIKIQQNELEFGQWLIKTVKFIFAHKSIRMKPKIIQNIVHS